MVGLRFCVILVVGLRSCSLTESLRLAFDSMRLQNLCSWPLLLCTYRILVVGLRFCYRILVVGFRCCVLTERCVWPPLLCAYRTLCLAFLRCYALTESLCLAFPVVHIRNPCGWPPLFCAYRIVVFGFRCYALTESLWLAFPVVHIQNSLSLTFPAVC